MTLSRDRTGLTPDKTPDWKPDSLRVPPGSEVLTVRNSAQGVGISQSGVLDEVSSDGGTVGIAASPLPEQAEKIFHRASPTEISIITKPAVGKPLLWGLTYNNFTSTDSGGTKSEWWRQKRLIELVDAALYSTVAASATSGTWANITALEVRPGAGSGGMTLAFDRTQTAGAYKEYAVTVPASGRIAFVFVVSSSAPAVVTLTCGAATANVDIRKTVAVSGKLEISIAYLTGCTPGAGTLRVTHAGTNGTNMYVCGPLIADLTMMMPKSIPANTALITSHDAAGRVIDQNGAVEMAMYDTADSLWKGSYHGLMAGSSDFMEGATVVDVSTTGGVTMFRDFALRQSGDLGGKFAYETLHAFRSASELACQVALNGGMTVSSCYQAMTTANIAWTSVDVADFPADGVKYAVTPKARFAQYAPGTPSKRLIMAVHDLVLNGAPQLPTRAHVQVTSGGPYAKVRAGIADGETTPITVNNLRYTVSHRLAQAAFVA